MSTRQKLRSIIAFKIFIGCFLFGLFSAIAMPKYIDLNNRSLAQQCKTNQIIVETALAVAYAENLAKGVDAYPEELTAEMFADGNVPTCPYDGQPIKFDKKTGKAFCPNHIEEHSQMAE